MRARGGSAALGLVAAGFVLAGCGGASSPKSASAAARAVTAAQVQRFRIDGVPSAAVGLAGRLWLGDDYAPRLYEIDPATGRIVRRVDLDRTGNASLLGLAPLGQKMWVGFWSGPGNSTQPAMRTVSLANASLGRWTTIRAPVDDLSSGFALNSDAAFLAGYRTIVRFPLDGGPPLRLLLPDPNDTVRVTAIDATPRVLWAAVLHVSRASGTVVKATSDLVGFDPVTLKENGRRALGDVTVTSLLSRQGQIWAATVDGPVLRLDAKGTLHTISFPSTTQSLLADPKGVWVIELKNGLVDHISDSGRVDETIRFAAPDHTHVWDDTPQELAALPGQLWVADLKWGYLWRIMLRRGG